MYGCGKRSDGVEVFRRLGRGPRWLLIIILISSFYTNSGENGEHCPGVFGRLIQESAQAQVQVPRSRCPGAPWFRKPGQNFFGGIKLAATNYNQKAHLPWCASVHKRCIFQFVEMDVAKEAGLLGNAHAKEGGFLKEGRWFFGNSSVAPVTTTACIIEINIPKVNKLELWK